MVLYLYVCDNSDCPIMTKSERREVSDRDRSIPCECGGTLKRRITAPSVVIH